MGRTPSVAAALAVVLAFVLLVAYVSAYAALLEPQTRLAVQPDGHCSSVRAPSYRAGGKIARYAFWPAAAVDQLVRPRYWDGT